MDSLKLPGLDGSHLFGFLATYGLLRLLHLASLRDRTLRPRLHFEENSYCAAIDGVPSAKFLEETVLTELQTFRKRLTTDFLAVDRPSDLTQEAVEAIAKSNDPATIEELAGLGCNIGGEAHESTLCAANGASHQKLVASMRDVLAILELHPALLSSALTRSWSLDFELTPKIRVDLNLGDRKPTLRLDPSDERLYALRLENPTSKEAPYRTELGGQALAAAAFGGLPVVPRQPNPVTVSSERKGLKAHFYWGLWSVPASYTAVRSLVAGGIHNSQEARARGVFAGYRATRVTGDKGKLSFAPTEPWW